MAFFAEPGLVNMDDKFISTNSYVFQDSAAEFTDHFFINDVATPKTVFLGGLDDDFSYTFEANGFKSGVKQVAAFTSDLERFTTEPAGEPLGDTFYARSDRIQVVDDGRVAFDTDRGMPNIYDSVSGSVSLPAHAPDGQNENINIDNYTIGSGYRADTDFILLMLESPEFNDSFLAGDKINANGTVHIQSVFREFVNGDFAPWVAHSILDFYVDGTGVLIASNRWFNQDSSITIPAVSINFTAYLGKFPS